MNSAADPIKMDTMPILASLYAGRAPLHLCQSPPATPQEQAMFALAQMHGDGTYTTIIPPTNVQAALKAAYRCANGEEAVLNRPNCARIMAGLALYCHSLLLQHTPIKETHND